MKFLCFHFKMGNFRASLHLMRKSRRGFCCVTQKEWMSQESRWRETASGTVCLFCEFGGTVLWIPGRQAEQPPGGMASLMASYCKREEEKGHGASGEELEDTGVGRRDAGSGRGGSPGGMEGACEVRRGKWIRHPSCVSLCQFRTQSHVT